MMTLQCIRGGLTISAKYGHCSVIRKMSQKQAIKGSTTAMRSTTTSVVKNEPEKLKLLPKEELIKFQKYFPTIVHQLTTLPELTRLDEANDRIAAILDYNVPHGKLVRSQIMIIAHQHLVQGTAKSISEAQLYTLGWGIEMLQGSACIADDLVDRSLTRRNRPCWHLQNDLGIAAMNDGFLLENLSYRLLELNFKDEPFYADLISFLHGIAVRALCGQSYDVTNCGKGLYDKLTMETYSNMMKFKNGFYTFYGPFAGALIVNSIKDQKLYKQLEDVTLDIGLLYSIQDDFMDCFIDESLTGKKGTDIADGKYSWPLVVALERANESQRKIIVDNYGQGLNNPEKIERVKDVYVDLRVPEIFKSVEQKSRDSIKKQILDLPSILPRQLFHDVVQVLMGRTR